MSLVVIDTETGGFDAKKNPLLSVALVQLDDNFDPKATMQVFVLPEPGLLLTKEACDINGYTPELWRANKAVPLKDAMHQIKAWLPFKSEPLAHNATFDKQFWEDAEERTNVKTYLGYAWNCSMAMFRGLSKALAWDYPNAKLETLARACGHWAPDRDRGAHQAIDDALAAAAGWKWLMQKAQDGKVGQRALAI